ncbi:response regulator [Stutzerimonas azotifigens]|uniref:response regulator n=1 Tax=Stutzerimonas azotifigens TaxID=291995 RepID=UPI0004877398|nr:response regulator [Stutzerimonas azotifigens]
MRRIQTSEYSDINTAAAVVGTRSLAVLVVEDEPTVRLIICSMLNDLGHSTYEANSAEGALEFLTSNDSIDLVVTDFSMEGMTGGQLITALKQDHSELPVILATGDTSRTGEMEVAILKKPFFLEDLDRAISTTITQRAR